jgi:hypothetical protein
MACHPWACGKGTEKGRDIKEAALYAKKHKIEKRLNGKVVKGSEVAILSAMLT